MCTEMLIHVAYTFGETSTHRTGVSTDKASTGRCMTVASVLDGTVARLLHFYRDAYYISAANQSSFATLHALLAVNSPA